MKKVIYPGTFDPPTLGHLDIIRKAASIFDLVFVGIGSNCRKTQSSFSVDDRISLLEQIINDLPNVEIITFSGLLVDCALDLKVNAIIRSIRNVSDFDYEILQSQMNRKMGNIETLYMMADEQYRFISSSLIREIASHGKRLHAFVPEKIENFIFEHLSPKTLK